MKNYLTGCEMLIRQVEAVPQETNWLQKAKREVEAYEKGTKLFVYLMLCGKIEDHHWKTNFRGTRELLDLEIKKRALARFMGLANDDD